MALCSLTSSTSGLMWPSRLPWSCHQCMLNTNPLSPGFSTPQPQPPSLCYILQQPYCSITAPVFYFYGIDRIFFFFFFLTDLSLEMTPRSACLSLLCLLTRNLWSPLSLSEPLFNSASLFCLNIYATEILPSATAPSAPTSRPRRCVSSLNGHSPLSPVLGKPLWSDFPSPFSHQNTSPHPQQAGSCL